jgi:hypothetical protein
MRCLKVVAPQAAVSAQVREGNAGGTARIVSFHDALLADDPGTGANFVFTPHRGAVGHPGAEIRVHSMPEEYVNG